MIDIDAVSEKKKYSGNKNMETIIIPLFHELAIKSSFFKNVAKFSKLGLVPYCVNYVF